jgi:predicted DNA-binding mobile mystery protein A
MRAKERAAARRQLDKRLQTLQNSAHFARPPRGWVKAIREALGMTTMQLGWRIGVGQSRAVEIEKAEVSGSLTLDSLERAAHALDCELVYVLVPRIPLQAMVEKRAAKLARSRVAAVQHTMDLEDQGVREPDKREQVVVLARELAEQSGSLLWNEE